MAQRNATKAPTDEIGSTSAILGGVMPWSTFIDLDEYAPDLIWPQSIKIYDQMPNDGQIRGLLAGTILPIRRFRWAIDPNGAPDNVVQHIADDYRLPIVGDEASQRPQPRRRDRFSWAKHLPEALRALTYGHYGFEQVGVIGDDGLWHIKKLAPRPPKTVMQIDVDNDGGLSGIKQSIGAEVKPIPVERLLWYVWDQEGANWVGRSMLRACFRNWLIKDRLMRVDATKQERTGMGIPIASAPKDASPESIRALDAMMQRWKSGESAGGAIPDGADVKLVGTTGTIPDTIASMRFHNEEMGTAFLEMFMNLGSTRTGNRALGETFVNFFNYSQEAVAEWVADTFNAHMIEDDVDWNYGEETQAPLLVYDRGEDEELAVADLAMLVEKGAVTVDPELEAWLRRRYKMPAKPEGEPTAPPAKVLPQPASQPVAAGEGRRSGARRNLAAAEGSTPSSSLTLPDRDLRRQPFEQEIQAQVDFAAMDQLLETNVTVLSAQLMGQQELQILQLIQLIKDANGDVEKLAAIQADPVHYEQLLDAMSAVASAGIDMAHEEATAQGQEIEKPTIAEATDSLVNRANATDSMLARGISQSAATRAVALTAESVPPATVAEKTGTYLRSLTGSFLKDRVNGALTQAMNTGRKLVFRGASPTYLYASELLDPSTCEPCASVDGTEYPDLSSAEADYPSGGYSDCQGGDRCRGTLIAIYGEAPSTK